MFINSCTLSCTPVRGATIFWRCIIAQTLIKVDYKDEKCAGLYYVDSNYKGEVVTKETAPTGRGTFKFVLRQTITIPGAGKVTRKETFTKSGMTFLKSIQAVLDEREPMRERIINKMTGKSEAEEEALVNDLLTVDELWDRYYRYKTTMNVKTKRGKRWQGATASVMKSNYQTLIKLYLGDMRVMAVKKKHVEDCMAKAKERGLADRALFSIKAILKPMYDWHLDREELDKRNPASIELGTLENERNVTLPWEQIQNLYKIMYSYKNIKYRNLFIWLSTGRRIGEALSLRVEQIYDGYYTILAENNKAEVNMIYKLPEGVEIPEHGYIHTGVKDPSRQLSAESVSRHWDNIRQLSELPDINKHDLRHIITTSLRDSGVPLEIRGMVIGHKGGTITDRYTTDTKERANLKAVAVKFFLDKVFNKIDKDMLWENYIRNQ